MLWVLMEKINYRQVYMYNVSGVVETKNQK